MMKNKKAVTPLIIILGIFGFVLLLYFLIHLPFFPFTLLQPVKVNIDYFLIILLFFAVQGILIYGYYKLGGFVYKGFIIYRKKLMGFSDKINRMVANN